MWDPKIGPVYGDISQGTTGDCWLDATMASIAYTDPTHLEGIMHDPKNSAGTVTVDLWDGSTMFTQTVTKTTMSDWKSQYSNTWPSQVGTVSTYVWPAAMEQAFQAFAKDHPELGMPGDLNGAPPERGLKAIYGSGYTTTGQWINTLSEDQLWAILNSMTGQATIFSTPGNPIGSGLPEGHAYTGISCNEAAGTVTLRNPWGIVSQSATTGVTDKGNGVFDISFTDFKNNFVYTTHLN